MKSSYVIQHDPKTHCPECGRDVELVCRRDGAKNRAPWFYICFDCELVVELGKGEVEREE